MDKQKVLNDTWNTFKDGQHWSTLPDPSRKNQRMCAYRGDDGQKCALGVYIPDDKYVPAMENNGVMLIIRNWPGALIVDGEVIPLPSNDVPPTADEHFLIDIQSTHDGPALSLNETDESRFEEFRINISALASRWQLKDPTDELQTS